MKAVVIGGSGFLGSHVADELTRRGYVVTIFDRVLSPYLKEGQQMLLGDLLDAGQVDGAVKKQDVVYNFAGIADLDDATTKPLETVNLNIMGNINAMDASVRHEVKRFVFASSIYVYSEKGGFYRCSKQASEVYLEEYSRRWGLPYTVLRYGTLYGTRSNERNSVHRYLKNALENQQIVCSNPEEMREYIYVSDAAALSVDVLENEQYKNQHIILTGHYNIKVSTMLMMVREILNDKVSIEIVEKAAPQDHYKYTPYSYAPKIGKKLVSNYYTDMGQGLLECLDEIARKLKNATKNKEK